ncbi:MAG TPA: ribonuclease J [Thermomicrobiales bacterium]|nr:ribonuclease J [Thermomicrobiales bacterium]
MSGAAVRLIFLGGIAEVGKNLFLLETERDIIIVDCGLGFPEEDQLGIDLVLPDISYLRERRAKIRAIFITHGHEDHIGGLAYLWPDLRAPIYATRLTAGLIEVKLKEAKLLDQAEIRVFEPDERPRIEAGDFTVEPFRVCHSIPDSVGFGITTPAGLIVHTSDFKFDPTPVDGKQTDFELLGQFGDRGVKLLVSDCVHVEATGTTPSERVVGETYDQVFAAAPGRIIIATFASLIARVQQIIDTAARYDRRVVTLGRSLENNVRVATELGYLQDPNGVLISPRAAKDLDDNRLVYIVTGSQGEPMAVLSRIANRDHREVTVGEGDTVIVSATPIPGNETSVFRIINQLFRSGAEVIYSARALVHVSGHASQDELVRMIELTRPEEIIPTHGEHRHLALYTDLAVAAGIPRERIHTVEIGDVLEIDEAGVRIREQLDVGYVYVEGVTIGTVTDEILRDRKALANDGMVMIVVNVDRETGLVMTGPDVVTRGFSMHRNGTDLTPELCDHVASMLEAHAGTQDSGDWSYLGREIRETAASWLYARTRRRPMILPMVLEI